MGERSDIIPAVTNEATQLILGLVTKPVSNDRMIELSKTYGCSFYYMPDANPLRTRVAQGVAVEDFRTLRDRYLAAETREAKNTIGGSVDLSNIVAKLDRFKFKRILSKNIVLVAAHIQAVDVGHGRPWSTDTPGQWFLRGIHRPDQRYAEIVNIDWCSDATGPKLSP